MQPETRLLCVVIACVNVWLANPPTANAEDYATVTKLEALADGANLKLSLPETPANGQMLVRGGIPNIVKAWRADDGGREPLQFGFNSDASEVTIFVPKNESASKTDTAEKPVSVDCLTAEETTEFPDGRIVLSALDANVIGKQAKLESHPGSHRIGYWANHDDFVRWELDTTRPVARKYNVELVYSRAGKTACDVTVQIDGNDLLAEIAPTGSWYRYRVDSLGTASLRRDQTHRIEVRSRGDGGAVMNLKAVVLTPIGTPAAQTVVGRQDSETLASATTDMVDYSRDIRPILSDKCFHCHGPDAANQDSEFRLDSRENVFADLGGYFGVVPGDLAKSELHTRIHSTDEGDMMPPRHANRQLSSVQKEILGRWIEQGAPYADHWSFAPPVLPEPPTSAKIDPWAHNPIDGFVMERLHRDGFSPSPEAGLATLYRRACLTLTGLPPTPTQVAALMDDPSEHRYENAVDRLLQSMHYAEHQALRWLDAARFADTDGYQNDGGRTNWPWRDWVIQAFDTNMPFDQFAIEQIAGDMLPDASESQLLASAFNRNHRQNSEGGALAAEFLVENIIDRVETTSTVFLGLTMGCCRCHDHKYDPLSQEDFYQFYGYFNNIGEKGIGKGVAANPVRKVQSPLMKLPPAMSDELQSAQSAVATARESLDERMAQWVTQTRANLENQTVSWVKANITLATTNQPDAELGEQDDSSWKLSRKGLSKVTYTIDIDCTDQAVAAIRLEALPDDAFTKPRRLSYSVNGNFVVTDFTVFDISDNASPTPIKVSQALASFEQSNYPLAAAIDENAASGWAVFEPKPIDKIEALFALERPVNDSNPEKGNKPTKLRVVIKHQSTFADHSIGRFRLSLTDEDSALSAGPNGSGLSPALRSAIQADADERTDADKKLVRDHYVTIDPVVIQANKQLQATQKRIDSGGYGKVSVMVMSEREGKPAPIYLLNRGQYNEPDKSKELRRSLPVALLDQDAQPSDRLELARWLVSPDNPLTARVTVNRIWQDHFGVGLVKTSEDFGLQGETPSHPGLLDWLATTFMQSGWDVKALHRLIVTSATYRQSSKVDAEAKERDPENRLLARGPRYRMDGFSIRDSAFQAAGLLNEKVGGPPVKPYQPEGLWNVVASGAGTRYSPDKGDKLYRKSMYTYWKRAVNPPRQIIFDASGREVCNVRTRVTNTPLQALVLMNDQTFWEAARHVAQRTLQTSDKTSTDEIDRLGHIYQLVTGYEIDDPKLQVLQSSLQHYRQHFTHSPDQAQKLLAVGNSPRDESLDEIEHAAWTVVAHILLNLDETITIE